MCILLEEKIYLQPRSKGKVLGQEDLGTVGEGSMMLKQVLWTGVGLVCASPLPVMASAQSHGNSMLEYIILHLVFCRSQGDFSV